MGNSISRRKLWAFRKQNKLCIYCGLNSPKEKFLGCKSCLEKKVKSQVKFSKTRKHHTFLYRKKVRKKVIELYGGKCVCCDENELLFLTIDHINNNGNDERKKLSNGRNSYSGTGFYLKLLKEEKRHDLQVLCYNCNLGRANNGGICPHKVPSLKNYKPEKDFRTEKKFDVGCKIVWPSNEELIIKVNEQGFVKVASELNVHKDSIRNRLKRRNLTHYINKKKNQYG